MEGKYVCGRSRSHFFMPALAQLYGLQWVWNQPKSQYDAGGGGI